MLSREDSLRNHPYRTMGGSSLPATLVAKCQERSSIMMPLHLLPLHSPSLLRRRGGRFVCCLPVIVPCFICLPVIVPCFIYLPVIVPGSISLPAINPYPISLSRFFRLLGTGCDALALTFGIHRLHRNDLIGARLSVSINRSQIQAVLLNSVFPFMADGQKRSVLRIQRTNVVFHFVGPE